MGPLGYNTAVQDPVAVTAEVELMQRLCRWHHFGLAHLRAAQRQASTYQAAIPAAVADLDVTLAAGVVADAEEASNEIARFDAELGDQIAPFSSVLLRPESAASATIENLTASARAIAEAEALGDTSRGNAAMIVRNTEAIKGSGRLGRPNSTRTQSWPCTPHSCATATPTQRDTGRTEQVWIGGGTFGPRGADAIAAHHTRVPDAITDLLAFAGRADVSTLPQMAIAHAQFETIHPFSDGSGRTGRALIQAILRNKRLTRQITVPVSAGLLTNTDAYFDALGSYRQAILLRSWRVCPKRRCSPSPTDAASLRMSDRSAKNGTQGSQLVASPQSTALRTCSSSIRYSTHGCCGANLASRPATHAGMSTR